MIKITIAMLLTLGLTGCAGMLPDVAQMLHDIEDTAVVVEVNRDAIKENCNVDINVKVTNKHPPSQ